MSEAMRALQERVFVKPDGEFGPMTARAIQKYYDLTPERAAHLLGQASHESGGFKLTRENLNYSAEAMCRVWPSRFPNREAALPFERKPAALAEKVYGGRMGNTPGTNDAWMFAGKGFLQLTGRDNYRVFAADMRSPEVMDDPDLVATSHYAMDTAYWYFDRNRLWSIADDGVNDDAIKRITRKVNGGYHGLEDRANQTKAIYRWLT
jgi:putative chitinase